jgi:hypothetical protein
MGIVMCSRFKRGCVPALFAAGVEEFSAVDETLGYAERYPGSLGSVH